MCISGCDALETVHHVFVSCPAYNAFRQHATQTLITETWPQSLSRFYLGLTPPLPAITGLTGAKTSRLLVRIAHTWHTSCIRLAGRIWAEYRRRVRPAPSKKKNNVVAIDLPSFLYCLDRCP
ncbi:hypothetical protein EV421DRAFT_2055674 [Armillaria borealis]|uniref:Uncharacterized protein n=1 Tax=Armillaria borealis TaxID=47425 RepID=A0AA39MSE3_9AGAR|nr:hypothetical protein EV421DRAFT_2055674 [Armillaria borealis]